MSWVGILVLLCMCSGVLLTRDHNRHCNCHGEMPFSAQDASQRIGGVETALHQAAKRIKQLTSKEGKDHELLEDTVTGAKELLWRVEDMEENECGAVPPADRIDCGFPGIHHSDCNVRGCCWNPLEDGVAGPWCFMKESGRDDDECYGKFKCYTPLGGSGERCIDWQMVCDGHHDCDSGFDEDDFVCKERLPPGSHWHAHLEDFGHGYECVRWRYKSADLVVRSVTKPFGTGLPTVTADIHVAYWGGAWSEVKHANFQFTGKTTDGGRMVFVNPTESIHFYLWFTGANDDRVIVQPSLDAGTLCPGFEMDRMRPQCKIEPRDRKDCGYPGISHHVCSEVRGCCYHALNEPGPWCFHHKSTAHDDVGDTWEDLDRECKVGIEDREDCGYPGISEHVCSAVRGCCFHELTGAGNWCYKTRHVETESEGWEKLGRSCKFNIGDRKDCGFPGIHADVCTEMRGCCYHELEGPGPWCFYNKPAGLESPDSIFERLSFKCKIESHVRKDCGYAGIPKLQCTRDRGCCYHELDGPGPWCFYNR